jgi:hypothetical protein
VDAPLAEAVQRGWLEVTDGHVQPTELGRRFTNDVVSLFLEDPRRHKACRPLAASGEDISAGQRPALPFIGRIQDARHVQPKVAPTCGRHGRFTRSIRGNPGTAADVSCLFHHLCRQSRLAASDLPPRVRELLGALIGLCRQTLAAPLILTVEALEQTAAARRRPRAIRSSRPS